jgi:hypothetical protein
VEHFRGSLCFPHGAASSILELSVTRLRLICIESFCMSSNAIIAAVSVVSMCLLDMAGKLHLLGIASVCLPRPVELCVVLAAFTLKGSCFAVHMELCLRFLTTIWRWVAAFSTEEIFWQ